MEPQGRSRLIIGGLALAAVVLVVSLLLTQMRNRAQLGVVESPLAITSVMTGTLGANGETTEERTSSAQQSPLVSSAAISPLPAPDTAGLTETTISTETLTGTLTETGSLTQTETVSETIVSTEPTESELPVYAYEVVATYPHDPKAYTQGLQFVDGNLYEGTGLLGFSSLRRVDLETGEVEQQIDLADQYFGEGITVIDDRIYQLTWQSNVAFLYNRDDFELLAQFTYPTEGWGLTFDGEVLIMSDGSPTLYRRDPESFEEVGQIEVRNGNDPVNMLNELEYIDGEVWANIWQTDEIVMVNPESGQVTASLDLSGLLPRDIQSTAEVLNGIAYDEENDRIFVTGKFWPTLFEIELVPR
jgi:glutamine cyclotransferase